MDVSLPGFGPVMSNAVEDGRLAVGAPMHGPKPATVAPAVPEPFGDLGYTMRTLGNGIIADRKVP
jgi:hypothetical protein